MNQVVVWDRVVNSAASAKLDVAGAHVKYPLIDQGKELRGAPVSLTLHWDVMPLTGKLYASRRGNFTVALPEAYCSEGACELGEPLAVEVDAAAPRGKRGRAAAA